MAPRLTTVIVGPLQIQSTSVPESMKNDCTCVEFASPFMVSVSAASLLVIVTLTVIVVTQCLLMNRMKKLGGSDKKPSATNTYIASKDVLMMDNSSYGYILRDNPTTRAAIESEYEYII